MQPESLRGAVILTGPTGTGKSELALELADRLAGEIVSMDSMALYRGMDIGTAKPSAADQARVPHHLIDMFEPWESASVAWWLDAARRVCDDIAARGKVPLIVGGTPLYLKALLFGLFEGPSADLALRAQLEAEAVTTGPEALHARLRVVDEPSAARLHPKDTRRVVRALEVWHQTGRPLSQLQREWGSGEPLPGSPLVYCLERPREELYARIDRRGEAMFAAGLVEEVRALFRLPHPPGREASQALGYKEVVELLQGRATAEQTVARVQQRSRNFAKRQLTWFRRLPGLQHISVGQLTMTQIALRICDERSAR